MQFINFSAFCHLDREKQSLYIRSLFEYSSQKPCMYGSEEYDKFVESLVDGDSTCSIVFNANSYWFVGDEDTLQTLTLYNETLFNLTERFALDDNVYATTVTPDTILRYTTYTIVGSIPGIQQAIDQSGWRTNAEVLDYSHGEPRIVLRGLATLDELNVKGGGSARHSFYTFSCLGCDANAIVTEQLINYKNVTKDHCLPLLEFPLNEGRGAYFCYSSVPFHAYNSNLGNDKLCQYLGLLPPTLNYDAPFWQMQDRLSKVASFNMHVENIRDSTHYCCLPTIVMRQNISEYFNVLTMPLMQYVLAGLQYQRSLPREDRIKNQVNYQSMDQEIDNAIIVLMHYMNNLDHSTKDNDEQMNSFRNKP